MKSYKIIPIALILLSSVVSAQKTVEYNDDTTKLEGYYTGGGLKTKGRAGVIVLHAWKGITEHERNTADKLGAMGFHVLAADIYGKGIRPENSKDASATAGFYKKNIAIYHSRIRAAINELVKQGADADKIVIMGYCFGGTGAIEAGRAGLPVKGIVSFHGGLGKDSLRTNAPIRPRVLILHGADDPFVPAKDIAALQQELREGRTDWQMIYYSNAVHSFTNPSDGTDNSKGAAYNPLAAERSWKALLAFLDETLKN